MMMVGRRSDLLHCGFDARGLFTVERIVGSHFHIRSGGQRRVETSCLNEVGRCESEQCTALTQKVDEPHHLTLS